MKPRLTDDLLNKNKKNKHYKKWLSTIQEKDKVFYLYYKKPVEKDIQSAKQIYYSNAFTKNVKNNKKTWPFLKEALGATNHPQELSKIVS